MVARMADVAPWDRRQGPAGLNGYARAQHVRPPDDEERRVLALEQIDPATVAPVGERRIRAFVDGFDHVFDRECPQHPHLLGLRRLTGNGHGECPGCRRERLDRRRRKSDTP